MRSNRHTPNSAAGSFCAWCVAVWSHLAVTPIKSSTGPRFLIASTPYQLDTRSNAKSTKNKDDSVWCQKLHGLKPQEVLNPTPLFSYKGCPTGLNSICTTGIKGVWEKHPPQRRKRLAAASKRATMNCLITKIFLPFFLSYYPRQMIWNPNNWCIKHASIRCVDAIYPLFQHINIYPKWFNRITISPYFRHMISPFCRPTISPYYHSMNFLSYASAEAPVL